MLSAGIRKVSASLSRFWMAAPDDDLLPGDAAAGGAVPGLHQHLPL